MLECARPPTPAAFCKGNDPRGDWMTTFKAGEAEKLNVQESGRLSSARSLRAFRLPRRDAAATDPERSSVVGKRARYDERDNVQSRGTLEPGSADYEAFYALHPEWRRKDDLIRALPGMGRVGSPLDTPLLGTQHDFLARLGMSDLVDGPVAPERRSLAPERAAEKVKGFARRQDLGRPGAALGAADRGGPSQRDQSRRRAQPRHAEHRPRAPRGRRGDARVREAGDDRCTSWSCRCSPAIWSDCAASGPAVQRQSAFRALLASW